MANLTPEGTEPFRYSQRRAERSEGRCFRDRSGWLQNGKQRINKP